jgi:hypothetical protein
MGAYYGDEIKEFMAHTGTRHGRGGRRSDLTHDRSCFCIEQCPVMKTTSGP